MAVHPKEELLVHILDPSRSVEGNFRLYRVTKKDGSLAQGMLASESRTAVELVDTEGKRHPILREDIDELAGSNKSLMPDGFEKQVGVKDMAHLLEFLTQKGRFVPLPLDKVATAVSTKGLVTGEDAADQRLVFPDWKPKTFKGVPFVLVDPQGERVKNVVMLNGPNGKLPPTMPRAVTLPVNGRAKAVHLLGGVGVGSARAPRPDGPVSMTVRVNYEDGRTEEHPLRDGVHFADSGRRVDVPGSEFAFDLGGRQIRYLAVTPKRPDAVVKSIEFVKGPDASAPVVMAVTVEIPE
jgi:putative heme-binding domain-containing protein